MATTQRGCSASAEDFLARELLSKGYASIRLSAVRLKGPLCKVETNNGSSFHGCPLRSVGCDKHRHLGTLRCRQEGASTPSTPLGEAAQMRNPVSFGSQRRTSGQTGSTTIGGSRG